MFEDDVERFIGPWRHSGRLERRRTGTGLEDWE